MHQSVLLEEAIDSLNIKPDGVYIDGTYGRGGHSKALLAKLNSNGRLLIIDKDLEAIDHAKALYQHDERVIICHGSFAEIVRFAEVHQVLNQVSGLLLDLGVSSPQLDQAERGFSFLRDGPLDMRMDTSQGKDATTWLAEVPEPMLAQVLKDFGEERFAKRIARAIVQARVKQPITRTLQLAEIIAAANPVKEKNKHPATRSFQALRIFLNDELSDLQHCLAGSLEVLKTGGRVAVITFHSLEDQCVKKFFRRHAKEADLPRGLPVTEEELARYRKLTIVGKAIKPDEEEVQTNVRARSAKLRIAEKL